MIIKLSNQTLPDDPQTYVESERNRAARQKQLNAQVESQIRANNLADKRAGRLDRYFSKSPPNGRLLDIFRDALANFRNTNGETPRWLNYGHLEACFDRLQRAGILVVEVTEGVGASLGQSNAARTYKSEVTKLALANRRNARPPELDTLIQKLKEDIGESLQPPHLDTLQLPRGIRQVTADKWRVSLYFGGAQRALGCYLFETAVRLQDALAYYFSSYRRPAHYNTNEAEARQLLLQHPAVLTFCTALETLWLSVGILTKFGETPLDKAEQRWQLIESRLSAIETTLGIVHENKS